MPAKKRLPHVFFIDALRALAIFAVIILHNAADYDEQLGEIPQNYWWAGTIWNGLVRFCVPMFVIISGALLLRAGTTVSIKEVFLKRLPRILIPLVFWSIVYVLFDNYNSDKTFSEINVKELVKTFYEGPVAYHLWFLYMLIGIYLLYPVINFFITAAEEIHVRYFLIVWFLVNCIIGILDIIFNVNIGIELNFFTGYVGYFVLGYYLNTFLFTIQALRNAYLLGIAGFIISVLFPYLCIALHIQVRHALIESDFTPDIVFSAAGLFLWMKNKYAEVEKPTGTHKVINEISKESLGIYLVHVLVMEIIFSEKRSYTENLESLHPAWLIPLKAVIILIISYAVIKLIRLVPYLRKVAG